MTAVVIRLLSELNVLVHAEMDIIHPITINLNFLMIRTVTWTQAMHTNCSSYCHVVMHRPTPSSNCYVNRSYRRCRQDINRNNFINVTKEKI